MFKEKKDPHVLDCTTMSGCMLQGDILLENLLSTTILIVGDSRVGKSTLLNHLKDVPMKGVEDDYGEITIESIYNEGVEAKSSFTSVTLIPNISIIKIEGEEVGICDTAGFADEGRSHVEVFGVSYILDKILSKLQKVKFLLAISYTEFEADHITNFLRPIENFLRIINIDILMENHNALEAFINSISFVVTKATKPMRMYVRKIERAIEFFVNFGDNISNERKIILRILKSVQEHERIELFPFAENNIELEKSKILECLSIAKKNWNFYDIKQHEKNGIVFHITRIDDFQNLSDLKKENYWKEIKARKVFLENSFSLIKEFVRKGIENWYKSEIDYDEEFKEIEKIINNHPYGEFERMTKVLKVEAEICEGKERIVSKFEFINKLEELYKEIINLNETFEIENELERNNELWKVCFEILKICRKTFCRTSEQEIKFIIFIFINYRLIEEYKFHLKVLPIENSGLHYLIYNTLTATLPESIYNLKANFISKFNPSSDERVEFEKLVEDLVQHINELTDSKANEVLKFFINISILKAKDLISGKKFKDALIEMVKANEKFELFVENLPDESDREESLNEFCEFKQLEIMKKIGVCLEGMKSNSLAIQVYQHIQLTHLEAKCYERMINESIRLKEKLANMKEYAKFLELYGKREKLIDLYEEMIAEFECFPAERKNLKEKLNKLRKSKCNCQEIYVKDDGSAETVKNNKYLIEKIVDEIGLYFDLKEEKMEEDLDDLFNNRNSSDDESLDSMDLVLGE